MSFMICRKRQLLLSCFITFFFSPMSTFAQSETCQSAAIDIVLCLDNSGSMGSHYPKVQQFANDFIDKFTISNTDTKIAVLRFESDVDPLPADVAEDFSGTKSAIQAVINKPLAGGTTNTHKCIDKGKGLLTGPKARTSAAKLMVIITDGMPSDQTAAETSATSAMAAGIVILGVGANVGSYSRPKVLKMTSNQCPADRGGCSEGLKNPPQCVTPCDDHYVDATTFSDLPNIIDAVVDVACVDPGCQYSWGPWSEW
jgi:uncharacterized protein YegL